MSGVHNHRVGLAWPNGLPNDPDDLAIEYLYEDDDGVTHSDFDEGLALAAMILSHAIFLNSNWWEDKWPAAAKKTVAVCVNTNDVFVWGCADAETIRHDEIEAVYRHWLKDPVWGTAVWAMIRNRQMPQKPVEDAISKAGIWNLDELCREHGLRSNHYDGVSHVLAERKRQAYTEWCRSENREPLPFDAGWWEGWKEYISAHPNWNDAAWKKADDEAINDWKIANGFADMTSAA